MKADDLLDMIGDADDSLVEEAGEEVHERTLAAVRVADDIDEA